MNNENETYTIFEEASNADNAVSALKCYGTLFHHLLKYNTQLYLQTASWIDTIKSQSLLILDKTKSKTVKRMITDEKLKKQYNKAIKETIEKAEESGTYFNKAYFPDNFDDFISIMDKEEKINEYLRERAYAESACKKLNIPFDKKRLYELTSYDPSILRSRYKKYMK